MSKEAAPGNLTDRATKEFNGFVHVRGAREHNLKNIELDIPRDALVVFTGVSGSGKSSLAFGTLYAEAQRRYLESVSPYARRLFHQMAVPEVDQIDGLPPAVALQQQRGSPTTRSSVGSVTTLSNLLRMLYSRAGDYPPGQTILYAESFSPNTPEGACPRCHGLGRVYEVTEKSMVPDDSLTIRERAIAAWPTAWQGQNQRDILTTLGYDVDRPWKELPRKDRDWILFTDEQPQVPVYAGYSSDEVRRAIKRKEEPSYQGTFTGARRYVLQTFANTQSALMKKRVAKYMLSSDCPICHGKRLRIESLSVKFAGLDIADISRLPLKRLGQVMHPYVTESAPGLKKIKAEHPEKAIVTQRIAEDLCNRLKVLLDLGLGYLTLERSTPTLSPGELQRLRLATQVHSNLFGVVYVLDEPSAGLHPADTESLLTALDRLKASGNSLFVVEHELDVIRHADWIVDVGPAAGDHGGWVLYSGPPAGLAEIKDSVTRRYLFGDQTVPARRLRAPKGWLKLVVELLFLPSVYAPCPACHGARYNPKTLEIKYRGKNIAEVLSMTVDEAWSFFAEEAPVHRSLGVVREVGLGYLRLGQSATELSGGEAQRIKLATELQRSQRADTLYVLDEPTTGLHPDDVEKLIKQLDGLVDSGNTVIVIEHDMRVLATSDWVIDIGPGAGEEGGQVVASGTPAEIAKSAASRTAPYLSRFLK